MNFQPQQQNQLFNLHFLFLFMALSPMLISAEALLADSLPDLLSKARNNEERVRLLLDASERYAGQNNPDALIYAHQAEQLAVKSGYSSGESKACNQLGILYFNTGILDSAAYYFHRSLKKYPPDADAYSLAVAYNNLGAIYLATGNHENAINYFEKALDALCRFKSLNDSLPLPGITNIYNNLGLIYKEKQDYAAASDYFEKGIGFAQMYPKEQRIYAKLLNNYGGILIMSGQRIKALDSLEKALRIRQKIEDFNGLMASYSNLGFYYSHFNNLPKSVDFTKKAFTLAMQFDAKRQIVANAETLQSLYEEMAMADSSLKYLKIAAAYREQVNADLAAAELEKQYLLEQYTEKLSNINKKLSVKRWQLVFIMAVILLLLALSVLLFQRQRKKLLQTNYVQNQLKENTLELKSENEALQNEVVNMNRKLTVKAMKEMQENRLMMEAFEKLQKIRQNGNDAHEIERLIRGLKRTGEKKFWKEFEIHFLKTNQEFFKRLHIVNPNLNANDRRLCALLKIGLSTKEISQITGRSVESINKSRIRLRSKLKLTHKKIRLSEFLVSLE